MVSMMWWNGGAGWAGWLLMSVGMFAFWFLVIIAIRMLLPGVGDDQADRRRGRAEPQEPLRELDERLARGEMDVQAYRACRELLAVADPTIRPTKLP
jgi:putative membrane protein